MSMCTTCNRWFNAVLSNVRIPDDLIRQTGPLDVLDHAGIGESFGGNSSWMLRKNIRRNKLPYIRFGIL